MILASSLLAAALAFTPADARFAREVAGDLVMRHTPRDAGTVAGRFAANRLLDRANATGLDARLDVFRVDTPIGPRQMANVECVYESDPAAPWIVLVSHFDTKPGSNCPGANDGASTSGLLMAMAEILYENRPKGLNVMLLWTDGEECMKEYGPNDGLWGSRRAAKKYKESRMNVRAVLCLDMLGDPDLEMSIPKNSSPGLKRVLLKLAKVTGLEDSVKLSKENIIDDHVPFLEEGFRSADLIDFDFGGKIGENSHWHTPGDTMDKVSEESLLKAGKLLAAFLNSLSDAK